MSRQRMILVAVIVVIAGGTWWLIKNKQSSSDSQSENDSQLPSDNAASNYTVPPDIGMSVDNTGGMNFPQGESGFTYTVGQAQSLPTS